jgi:N-acetylmuramoyl-L-alanine amidase
MKRFSIFKALMQSVLLSGLVIITALSGVCLAQSQKDKYFEAEDCYKKLKNTRERHSVRDNWLLCIRKFQDVSAQDPEGEWAAAGLYMSGHLYEELHGNFFFKSDKKEAVDAFERLIRQYPKSRYRQKAADALERIRRYDFSGQKSKPDQMKKEVRAPWNEEPGAQYERAKTCLQELRKNPKKEKYRESWLACIDKFHAVYEIDPKGPWATAGLFMSAGLYEELYLKSFKPEDRKKSIEIYKQIISDFPESRYRRKAADRYAVICGLDPGCDVHAIDRPGSAVASPQKDQVSAIIEKAAPTAPGISFPERRNKMAIVSEIRYWSNPSYTRIVIDAGPLVTFKHNLLPKDPKTNKPPRVYIDLKNSRLSSDIQKAIPVDDNLLSGIRAGQYTPDTVRVVIDIKSFQSYKIFPLSEPYRIVVDLWGDKPALPKKIIEPPVLTGKGKIPARALTKQLALGVSRVVIDPGHGGKDPGATGYLRGVHEKEVTLKIARKLAEKIRTSLNCEVILTRQDDQYLTLEERTAIANTKNADLFISIHVNAHKDPDTHGIETYFLNLATDDESIRVAAMENATSTKNISDLHSILSDLMQNAKINESSRLACLVQESMVQNVKFHYADIKSNGVKQAPFYVLLGAQMPAILIETSFVSNPRECKRLMSLEYQSRLCDGIVRGVKKYIDEMNPS